MTRSRSSQRRKPHRDDIVLWPNGTSATREEVRNGHLAWKSDDHEIIDHMDETRLKAAGGLDGPV
ncbi:MULTISPECIES: hypothetical protein [Hyphomicrobiales]|uniref:hypothetical protein n=1 Tax=Hyphomicrobiales TaxID=356 RepID=UPI000C38FA8F|nr:MULTISPECIES: hypothetical protein [Hyphomicrobiales]MAA99198.1 hypothetical protein [Stappia sp.]MAM93364.1 hypothetical protein [Parvibaculum sp.]MBM19499.1 hypothetical protein [Stappia sp.]NIJ42866.1 hypothetical protein [Parvibaculum indicum]|tara:strand:+ start:4512 stop:4706 length:195 start_codon:yes stop_codon:yes gene_type:complete